MAGRCYLRLNNSTVSTSLAIITGANPARRRIVFTAPDLSRVTLAFDATAEIDQGPTLYPAGPHLDINSNDHGDGPTKAWYAIAAVATRIAWFEVIEDETMQAPQGGR